MKLYLLGDSLSVGPTSPGGILAGELERAGHSVTIDARVGRSAPSLLAEAPLWTPPAGFDLAIVFLGTNDTERSLQADREAFAVLKSWLASKGPRIIALGPPAFPARADLQREVPRVLGTLQATFGRANVFDIEDLTRDLVRTQDGIHFPGSSSAELGRRLAHLVLPQLGPVLPSSLGATLLKFAFGVGLIGGIWLASSPATSTPKKKRKRRAARRVRRELEKQ